MYDIVTFLVAHKKPSHFHSDLSYAINAKHLWPTLAQYNDIEQEQILRSKVPKFGYGVPRNA